MTVRTRRNSVARSAAAVAAMLLFASASSTALAHSPTRDEPDASPLAGPTVHERAGEHVVATLISRDFNGRITRLEVDPAIAAIERLTIDAATMERINTIIAERNAIVDRVVQEHLLTLGDLGRASESGDKKRAMEGLREVMQAAKPLRDRGRLIEEIAPLLPEAERAEARRMVNEYWRAIVRERMEFGPPDEPGKKIGYMEASANEMLLAFAQEGKNAFERTIGQQARQFEELIKKLNLTPEQESKIRALVQDSVSQQLKPGADGKTRGYTLDKSGQPAGRQQSQPGQDWSARRGKLREAGRFIEIYGMLDAEQRKILLKEMRAMKAYEPMGASGMGENGMGKKRSPSEPDAMESSPMDSMR